MADLRVQTIDNGCLAARSMGMEKTTLELGQVVEKFQTQGRDGLNAFNSVWSGKDGLGRKKIGHLAIQQDLTMHLRVTGNGYKLD